MFILSIAAMDENITVVDAQMNTYAMECYARKFKYC